MPHNNPRFTGFVLQFRLSKHDPNPMPLDSARCDRTPLGQNSTATAGAIQFMIKRSRYLHTKLSGLTLDLIKCFKSLKGEFGFTP